MAVRVTVIDYGRGNLGSVCKALEAVGASVNLARNPDEVRPAERLVLPGQGAFADCMTTLGLRGLVEPLAEKIRSGTPYLGLCLGLQILFEHSDEHGGSRGLGIVPGRVVRFADPALTRLKVPHMGWNSIRKMGDFPVFAQIAQDEYFYFVHSYYAQAIAENRDWVAATTDYGVNFVSAICRDNIHATQFHPEKSQTAGLKLLENFLRV